jgi:hypothetical protein
MLTRKPRRPPRSDDRLHGGWPIAAATISVLDGPDMGSTTSSYADGRYRFAELAQAGFTIRVTARGYTDATLPVTLIANQVVDVRLLLPLARLMDIDSLPARGILSVKWQRALIQRRPVNVWRSSSASGMNSRRSVTTPRNTVLRRFSVANETTASLCVVASSTRSSQQTW